MTNRKWLKNLLGAIVACVFATQAQSASILPKELHGTWCHLKPETEYVGEIFTRGPCKDKRKRWISIHAVGYFMGTGKATTLCAPLNIEEGERFGWSITSACGPDNNSGPIYRVKRFMNVDKNQLEVAIEEDK
jgi:hypothetical protein